VAAARELRRKNVELRRRDRWRRWGDGGGLRTRYAIRWADCLYSSMLERNWRESAAHGGGESRRRATLERLVSDILDAQEQPLQRHRAAWRICCRGWIRRSSRAEQCGAMSSTEGECAVRFRAMGQRFKLLMNAVQAAGENGTA
jgi:hypothetical protein